MILQQKIDKAKLTVTLKNGEIKRLETKEPGIVTAIPSNPQRNIEFYAIGFLYY